MPTWLTLGMGDDGDEGAGVGAPSSIYKPSIQARQNLPETDSKILEPGLSSDGERVAGLSGKEDKTTTLTEELRPVILSSEEEDDGS